MPGVLITEAMAQAGCIYFYYSKNKQGKKLIYYLGKISVKFFAPVVPGDQLRIEIATIKSVFIVTDSTSGKFEYRWQGTDTDTSGKYFIEFEITPTAGGKYTLPTDRGAIVRIIDDEDST